MLKHRNLALRKNSLNFAIYFLAVAAYVLSAKLGLLLATINSSASPVWPATGVAISLVYLLGYRAGLAIFAGAVIANWNTGLPWYSITLIATGNTLEAIIGVYLFKFLNSSGRFRLRVYSGIFKYSVLALIPTLISATVGTFGIWLAGALGLRLGLSTWVTWWVGDSLGVLMVFPIFYEMRELILSRGLRQIQNSIAQIKIPTVLITASAVVFFSALVFAIDGGQPYLFLLFFVLLGVAILLPFVGIYLAGIYISGYSIYMTQRGLGPFQAGATNDSLIHLELFLASLWLTCIVLAKLKKTQTLGKPAWAFAIGWLMTGVTFYSFYQSSTKRADAFFQSKVEEATSAISDTMNGYVRLLEAGAGLLNASDKLKREEWNAFVASLRLADRYPGLRGIGVIYAIPRNDIRRFELEWRKEFPGFKVHGTANPSSPAVSPLPESFIISLIEPVGSNLPALGLDISSELHRREAALKAAASGEAVLSEKISLMQSPYGFGYLLLVPIYDTRLPLPDTATRMQSLKGFVYAPIEADAFFGSATKFFNRELKLQQFIPDVPQNAALEDITNVIQSSTMLAGNNHRLLWKRAEDAFNSTVPASLVGFCGAFCTLVLATLVASLESIRSEAERIADQKSSEVQDRERIWKMLTEISPVGIFLTDKEGKVIYVNKKWLAITNIPLNDLQKNRLAECIHPEDREGVFQAWKNFSEGSGEEYAYEYRLFVNDRVRYIASYAVTIKDAARNFTGYLGIIQDMTEHHQNQLALTSAAKMSSLGQMAGGVAHEINSPLAIISGRAELLKLALAEPSANADDVNVHIDKIQETVQRIAKIIRGLRAVARDTTSEPSVAFSLRDAVQDSLNLCENKFRSQGIIFVYEPDFDDEVNLWGRPEQITQVLLNLLNNAYDACAQQNEKWIRLSCSERAGKFIIEISDSGTGIASRNREHLFNPFFTTKEVGHGTGLGLSISKSIIEKHGGTLRYASERPQTTFVIELQKYSTSDNQKAV